MRRRVSHHEAGSAASSATAARAHRIPDYTTLEFFPTYLHDALPNRAPSPEKHAQQQRTPSMGNTAASLGSDGDTDAMLSAWIRGGEVQV